MVNDLKEFLGKLRHDFVTDNQSNRDVNYFEEELGKFFLGEVARIKKEIKKCALLGKISECDYLEGRLDFVKELAGVEQNGE